MKFVPHLSGVDFIIQHAGIVEYTFLNEYFGVLESESAIIFAEWFENEILFRKMRRFKQQIADGTYNVDADSFAEMLLKKFSEI